MFFFFDTIKEVIYLKKKIVIITILSIILDQLSKYIIVKTLNVYQRIKVIDNFFYINYVKNQGAAWGILNNRIWLLIIITFIMAYFIIMHMLKETNMKKIDAVLYGLLLGGIFGNFIDRIVNKYVIDFLEFNIFGYSFPVFNLADTFIVVSVIIMCILSLVRGKNEKDSK